MAQLKDRNETIRLLTNEKRESEDKITQLSCEISEVASTAVCLSTEKEILENQIQAQHFPALLDHFRTCHYAQKLNLSADELGLIEHLLSGTVDRALQNIKDHNTFQSLLEVLLKRNVITEYQKHWLIQIFVQWVSKGKP